MQIASELEQYRVTRAGVMSTDCLLQFLPLATLSALKMCQVFFYPETQTCHILK